MLDKHDTCQKTVYNCLNRNTHNGIGESQGRIYLFIYDTSIHLRDSLDLCIVGDLSTAY